MQIDTDRLILVPLSLTQLRALIAVGQDDLPLPLSDQQRSAIAKKILKMDAQPAEMHPWFTYWLISTRESLSPLGLIGFKGLLADGSAEVGYGMFPGCEGRGYATEALRGLLTWAFSEPACTRITALAVLRGNFASQKVLEHNGFRCTGETASSYDYELLRQPGA